VETEQFAADKRQHRTKFFSKNLRYLLTENAFFKTPLEVETMACTGACEIFHKRLANDIERNILPPRL
jgi:hypothetical protein